MTVVLMAAALRTRDVDTVRRKERAMRPHVSMLMCGLILLVPRLYPQETDVKAASISLRPRAVAIQRVTIENRRNSPIVAWEVGLFAPGASQPSSTQYSDLSWSKGDEPVGRGPIKPNERRVIDVPLHNHQNLDVVALRMVAFADGHYEGTIAALRPWWQRRQQRADDLDYWIRAIDSLPQESAQGLRQYIARRAVDRAGQVKEDVSGLRDRMATLSRQQNSTLDNLLSAIERIRADAARELAVLRPSLAPADNPDGRVTSASLSSERATSTEFVVAIENLRSVPLEALAFEVNYVGARGGSAQSIDYCSAEPDTVPGRGRLMPGEVREFSLGSPVKEGDALPLVRLKYVMFGDLSFEGSPVDRNELLRHREQHAEELAYAIAALTQAAARPDQAEALLTATRVERARQLQQEGRQGSLANLDELIRQAKESPEQLAANAKARQEYLERERQRLLRHVSR
jgi:hypothetical protein